MDYEHADLPLDWIESDDEFIAETQYGRAIITEDRDKARNKYSFGTRAFRLRMEYVNGGVEKVRHAFTALSTAEGWAFSLFRDYDVASRKEGESNELLEFLDECRKLLPEKFIIDHERELSKIVHIIKIEYGRSP